MIDPYKVANLTQFWQTLADGRHTTIVHAAREELNFSLAACDRPPANLFDTQLAAGFCSTEYPSSYGSVVSKFLEPQAGQGRAADRLAAPAADRRANRLRARRRALPVAAARRAAPAAQEARTGWTGSPRKWTTGCRRCATRASGRGGGGCRASANLSPRSLAIVRELWMWRQAEAERRDCRRAACCATI